MRFLKILLFFVISISLVFPHHHIKKHHYGKSWNHKKKHYHSKTWNHKKNHHQSKTHYRPKFKLSLGYNYYWPYWNYSWPYWNWYHPKRDVIVVKEDGDSKKDENNNFEDIIAQIEKLAELKEKGIISEKEFEKKKKELLKRI